MRGCRRATVASRSVSSPSSLENCFGGCVRDRGQSRVPEPPARITARTGCGSIMRAHREAKSENITGSPTPQVKSLDGKILTDLRRGASRPGGLRDRAPARIARLSGAVEGDLSRARPHGPAAGGTVVRGEEARVRVPGRGEGRRDRGGLHLPRRSHPSEPPPRAERDPRVMEARLRAPRVPRFELHLSARLPPADPRRVFSTR